MFNEKYFQVLYYTFRSLIYIFLPWHLLRIDSEDFAIKKIEGNPTARYSF